MIRLRELREEKGITQIEFAKIFNLSASTIGMYEQGRRAPDITTLSRFAEYFGVSLDYIAGNSLQPNSNKKIPKDLKRILEEEEITLNGRAMSAEDKEKIYKVIEAMYWDAKEQNRRK